jgi:hypothetical protein
MLGKRDRWNAMGLTDEQAERAENSDDVNALLFEANKALTPQQAPRARVGAPGHAERVATLSDEDLKQAYITMPSAAGPPPGRLS